MRPGTASLPGTGLGLDREHVTASLLALTVLLFLLLGILLPLCFFFIRSLQAPDGTFVGLANYARYFATPGVFVSVWNTLFVGIVTTVITVALAFVYAYALTRSCMPLRGLFRAVGLIPLLAPSLLPALSFVYLFGTQGLAKPLLFGHSIYGPIGIVMSEVFYTFPHAIIILTAALALADARLYESARALKASQLRIFSTVTLTGIKYGLISAVIVVFTLVVTDFGIPKVIGGRYNVLATDVYKQVVGWHNFEIGAVVGLLLLCPALIAFAIDRVVQRRQVAVLSSQAVPFEPTPQPWRDGLMLLACTAIGGMILVVIGVAAFGSLVEFWPYNLKLTLRNYDFDATTDVGWAAYKNSFVMAIASAVAGTILVMLGAYLTEKVRGLRSIRSAVHLLAMLPMAVPGLVLGLAFIFFFNHPSNPLNALYGTMTLLVICTVVHFYTVPHVTAVTVLKQIDREFESISASLKVPFYVTAIRITVPITLPALLDISVYFFVNAMTTVSAVVFLYSSQTLVASVSVLYLDDNGATAAAAAMAMMIVYTSLLFRAVHWVVTRKLLLRAQRWRKRTARP